MDQQQILPPQGTNEVDANGTLLAGGRYKRTGAMTDLEKDIGIAKQALDLTPIDHPDRASRLNNLGNKLGLRYERTGVMSDLEGAIGIARQALDLTPVDHPNRAAGLNNLGIKLHLWYERTGAMVDLEKAIGMARKAVDLTSDDHPNQAAYLSNLGSKLESRYKRTGATSDLEEAIGIARQAVSSTPVDHPHRAGRLSNLGIKLGSQYERTGEMVDLEEAIGIARQAVSSTPVDHPDRSGRLHNLGNKLGLRYERTGKMVDLEEAISMGRQAVNLTSGHHPDRAVCFSNLGNKLESRYERTGATSDLEEAIGIATQALGLTPNDHLDRAGRLYNLGNKLGLRYEWTGEMADLEEAIGIARQAVNSTPSNHPDQAGRLNNLGIKLGFRYERTGEMADLEEAISIARQALDLIPDDHPNRAICLCNLGNKLDSRYERTGAMSDLEEAIGIARQALDSTPIDHPDRAGRLNNLGVKLESQYEQKEVMTDLEEAIGIAIQALDLTPVDHPNRAACLNNLGNKLSSRYKRIGAMADLEEAIRIARQALDSTPIDHPDRAGRLYNLGIKLGSRYERTGEMADLEEALLTLQYAWHCETAVPFHRVQAGAQCLKLLALQQKTDMAIHLGKAIIDLLPSVNTRFLDRSDQQFVLSTFSGVAADLCAFLLQSNQPADALRFLEKGRAVIIGQLMDARSDLSILQQQHPDIAHRYQQLRDEVNTPFRQVKQGAIERQTRTRRLEALTELDACIQEIRGITGHERFMLGQEPEEMQECVEGGSIVVVNVTTFRSDAIIVSSTAIKLLNLPQLAAKDAMLWLAKKWTGRRSERTQKNREYLQYLSWLWEACVKQILDEVYHSHDGIDDLPRIWWIGTGLASSMPFHAAGVHTRGSKENAYCRMISSYTPSIKALAYAQNQAKRVQEALMAQDTNTMFIAAMPTSPKGPGDKKAPKNLPGVEEEMREILSLARSYIRTTVHIHPSADQVLEVLKTCRIAHFACHGTSGISDPSNSGLILQKTARPDEALEQDRLTVRQVSDLRLKHAQIAYLSACSTAENKAVRLSDEVIHVVSGFQVAGFPHVVGCLWPAGDSECVEVAKRFYSLVLQRHQSVISNEVASALQEAVMAVRAEDLDMPLNWAQFVHYGV